jgi:hypothetical protein
MIEQKKYRLIDKTPLTKISTPKLEAQKISFEMESRI